MVKIETKELQRIDGWKWDENLDKWENGKINYTITEEKR